MVDPDCYGETQWNEAERWECSTGAHAVGNQEGYGPDDAPDGDAAEGAVGR